MFNEPLATRLATILLTAMFVPTAVLASDDSRPVFCKLSSAEMRARLGELRTEFLTRIVAVDELDRGFRYWVGKSEAHLVMLAKFVEFESNCCGFMDFEIGLAGDEDRVSLTITGTDGTKGFLQEMMKSVSFDWQAGS